MCMARRVKSVQSHRFWPAQPVHPDQQQTKSYALDWRARIHRSSDMQVRVLPVPVAMTSRALRLPCSKASAHSTDSFMLIGAVSDGIVDWDISEWFSILADKKQVLQVF